MVDALAGEQLIVRACLRHDPSVDNDDGVGRRDGAQAYTLPQPLVGLPKSSGCSGA